MERAEQERTTVDVVSADKQITLRATGTVTLFDGFLTLYLEGQDDGDRRGRRAPAQACRGRRHQGRKASIRRSISPSRRRAIPKPAWSSELEELGIGRPSTYASIISTLRDRAYVKMDRQRFMPEDKGRLVTTFLQQLLPALCRLRLHRRPGRKAGRGLGRQARLETAAARFLEGLLRRRRRNQGPASITPRHRRAGEGAGAAHLPGRRRRRRSAQMPVLRKWPAEPEAGPLRRLRRLHQLSGMQIHPPDRRQAGRRRCRAGGDRRRYPETEEKITLRTGRFGPYVQLRRRRQAQAQRHSQGHRQEPMSTWRWR